MAWSPALPGHQPGGGGCGQEGPLCKAAGTRVGESRDRVPTLPVSTALFPSALGFPQAFGPKSRRLRWGSGLESQTPGSFWTQHHPSKRSLQRGLLGGGGLGAGCRCLRQRGPGLGRDSARRRGSGTGRAQVVPPSLTQPAFPCPLGQRPQGSPGTPSRRLVQKLWGDSVLGEDTGCILCSANPHLLLQFLKPQSGDAPSGGPEGGLGTTPRPPQSVPGHLGVQGGGIAVGSGNSLEEKDAPHQAHLIGLAGPANPH